MVVIMMDDDGDDDDGRTSSSSSNGSSSSSSSRWWCNNKESYQSYITVISEIVTPVQLPEENEKGIKTGGRKIEGLETI